jgi:hypothetical protein
VNTPPRLKRAESQVIDISPRPPGVLDIHREYERRIAWLRAHSFALMDFNARQRKPGTVFRNPVAPEGKFPGINDQQKKRR